MRRVERFKWTGVCALAAQFVLQVSCDAGMRIVPKSKEKQLSPLGPSELVVAGMPSLIEGPMEGLGVVWIGRRREQADPVQFSVRARFFDRNLDPSDNDFLLNAAPLPSDNHVRSPRAIMNDDGYLVAAWDKLTQDLDDEENVVGVRTASLTEPGQEFLVNLDLSYSQNVLGLAGGPEGDWSAIWQNEQFAPEDLSVRLRKFHGAEPKSAEMRIASDELPFSHEGVLLRRESGTDVFWSASSDRITWQVFASHTLAETISPVALTPRNARFSNPSAAPLPDSRTLVVWRVDGGNYANGLYARLFDGKFEPLGPEYPVWLDPDPAQVRDRKPRIASSPGGQHSVVVWVVGDDLANERDRDIVGRLLDESGRPTGPVFFVPRVTDVVDQTSPSVKYLTDSTFVVVWQSAADPMIQSDVVLGRVFSVELSTAICGDANDDERITAADALIGLSTAVGGNDCENCRCDMNNSGSVTSVDALSMLRGGVGLPIEPKCPECPE